MSLESERAKPTVQLRTRAIWMSGAKALRLSARFAPTAIGYVGSGLNDEGVQAARLREEHRPRLARRHQTSAFPYSRSG